MTKDPVDALGKFAARRDIGLTLLSDPQSEMITAFGVRDDQYGTTGTYGGIASPTIFVVAADGTITHVFPVNHEAPPPIAMVKAALGG